MALDFPNSPSNGQTFGGPGGIVWTYDGTKWKGSASGGPYLPLTGGTLTGKLTLAFNDATPYQMLVGGTSKSIKMMTTANEARIEGMDQTGVASYQPLSVGGSVVKFLNSGTEAGRFDTGRLVLANNPTLPQHAVTKAYVDPVGLTFPFIGKPFQNGSVFVPIIMPLTIASNLAGTIGYANIVATANATFTLNKISGGVATPMGTITAVAGSKTSFLLSGAGGTLAAGDTVQLIAPTTQDLTLADLGITVRAMRT